MTPAEDPSTGAASIAERAELHLRLLAETELRHALALPRYEQPTPRDFAAPLRFAARAIRPIAAAAGQVARPLAPTAKRAAGTLQPWAERAVQPLQALAEKAQQTSAMSAGCRAQLAAQRILGRFTTYAHEPAPADDRLHRVQVVASALAAAGALDEATADSIVAGLETGLALRQRIDSSRIVGGHQVRWPRRPVVTRPPTGPFLAVSVGAEVPIEIDGRTAALRVLTLVLAPDRAVLTWTVSEPADDQRRSRGHPPHGFDPFHQLDGSATDDRGLRYELSFSSGGGGGGHWDGAFDLSPVPQPGAQWLDLVIAPDTAPIRVDLTGMQAEPEAGSAERADPRRAEPPGTSAEHVRPLSAERETSPPNLTRSAERFLDSAAENLLQMGLMLGGAAEHELAELTDVVEALRAAGALPADSPALGRLVTLARRQGVSVPRELADVRDTDLPESWANLLSNADRADGPVGLVPLAVVLPELDGFRCVLAGLRSDQSSATLDVLAWGWQSPHFGRRPGRGTELFSWSARDDTGRWHLVREGGGSFGDGHADFRLELTPPLHPAASALQIILTGPSGRVSTTVPLRWQDLP